VVGDLGNGETLRFAVSAPATGRYALTLYYIAGEQRAGTIRVNGGRAVWGVSAPTRDWYTVGSMTIPLDLVSGGNTIEFGNPRGYAPDIDRIVVR
jgi:hypothetical protein